MVAAAAAVAAAWCGSRALAQGKPVSYHGDVRPILQRSCTGCHQSKSRGGKLGLETFAQLKSGGLSGPSVQAGKPADSPLYKVISGKNPTMPKGGKPLPAAEVETIRRWIEQGARDDTPVVNDPISPERPPVYTAPPVVTALAYSPDGKLLAVSGYREVLLRNTADFSLAGRLVGRSQRIESVAFSPDGRYLVAVGGTSCRFGELQLWEVEPRRLVRAVEVGADVLYGVSFAPNGKMVACGGAERSAYLFEIPECRQVMRFDNHSDWVLSTAFSRDSKNFITTSRDKAIKLVEIATKNFVDDINYQVYKGGYTAIARNPQADEVAVAGEEGIIRYYSIFKRAARNINRDDFNLIRTFEKQPQPLFALAFSPDGALLAAAGRTGEIVVFKTADGSRVATLTGFSGSIHSLAFHPGGARLAAAGFDGKVHFYEMPSGKHIASELPVPMSSGRAGAGTGVGTK